MFKEKVQPPSNLAQRLHEGANIHHAITGDRTVEPRGRTKYDLTMANPPTGNVLAISVTPRLFHGTPQWIPVGHFDAALGRFKSYGIMNINDPEVAQEALHKMQDQSIYNFQTPEVQAIHLQQQEVLDTQGLKQTLIDRYNAQQREKKGLTTPELRYDDNTSFTLCLVPDFAHIAVGRSGYISREVGTSFSLRIQGAYTDNQYAREANPITIRLASRNNGEAEFRPDEDIIRSYELPLLHPLISTLEEATTRIPGFAPAEVAVLKIAA
jgi:hypothetical protein